MNNCYTSNEETPPYTSHASSSRRLPSCHKDKPPPKRAYCLSQAHTTATRTCPSHKDVLLPEDTYPHKDMPPPSWTRPSQDESPLPTRTHHSQNDISPLTRHNHFHKETHSSRTLLLSQKHTSFLRETPPLTRTHTLQGCGLSHQDTPPPTRPCHQP